MHAFSKRSVWSPASAQSLGLESGSPTRDPRPSSSDTGLTAPGLSVPAGSSQAPGLGLGGSPESGLSSPLSALQLITSSGSPSHTSGKFNLPTIAGGERQNFPRVKTTSCNRETFPVLSSATKKKRRSSSERFRLCWRHGASVVHRPAGAPGASQRGSQCVK